MRNLFNLVAAPTLASRKDLIRYVGIGTVAVVVAALAADVVNHLVFFDGWPSAIRSWLITIVVAFVISFTMLNSVGRANLALHRAKLDFEVLSRTDPLTGLANRRALLEEAEHAGATLLVLVIFDIDHFKNVNDTFGHRVGDVVLQIVARTLATELDPFGLVGRLGGEEFALLTKEQPPAALLAALHRLCDRLAATPILAEGKAVSVTISAGAAARTDEPLDTLYMKADHALYTAKRAGRNRICVSPELEAALAAQAGAHEAPVAAATGIGVQDNRMHAPRGGRRWRD